MIASLRGSVYRLRRLNPLLSEAVFSILVLTPEDRGKELRLNPLLSEAVFSIWSKFTDESFS